MTGASGIGGASTVFDPTPFVSNEQACVTMTSSQTRTDRIGPIIRRLGSRDSLSIDLGASSQSFALEYLAFDE